ncbi:VOC family protein [Glaciibacter sp. 2TAF33]|uniref:VOC family protein n=1 Tax=Glaciibacter sp. 2TAF33 TaxID=3233015 RepID=UPI003F91D60F
MLSNLPVNTVLAAQDLARARAYYSEKLGLEPALERQDGLMYRMQDGSSFMLYETGNAGSAKNTQMSWVTQDLEAEMAELRGRGVVFEDYDFPGLKTEDGVATMEGLKGAWFIDSEGNILSLAQEL